LWHVLVCRRLLDGGRSNLIHAWKRFFKTGRRSVVRWERSSLAYAEICAEAEAMLAEETRALPQCDRLAIISVRRAGNPCPTWVSREAREREVSRPPSLRHTPIPSDRRSASERMAEPVLGRTWAGRLWTGPRRHRLRHPAISSDRHSRPGKRSARRPISSLVSRLICFDSMSPRDSPWGRLTMLARVP